MRKARFGRSEVLRAAALAAVVLIAGCSRFRSEGPAPTTYAGAIAELERLTGSKGQPVESPAEGNLEGVLAFQTKPGEGLDLVKRHHPRLRTAGAFLFLHDHGFGKGPDVVGVAPATDKFDLIRRVQTNGVNYGHDNRAVIAWLREMDRDEPLEVIGAGFDFVEGFFRAPVKDRPRLARRIHAFCPDFVEQGIGLGEEGEPHALIEAYYRSNRDFFFWWD
jgi:Domain of unknown function (DUF4253)